MYTSLPVADNIFWVGANDRRLERFENLFPLEKGVSYNSYLIIDEKTCLMDTIDGNFIEPLMENVMAVLQNRPLDYLVINHMEPDHAAAITRLCGEFPQLKVVGNSKTLNMIQQFFDFDIAPFFHEVKEGDTLALGRRTLQFINAPMVHWPEVMFSYETSEKILFTADAFGTFGALNGAMFADEVDFEAEYLNEARRYYANIVGKYGPQVQAVLKKAAKLEINQIFPLHGPIWRENLGWFINKYDLWSRYQPEEAGVVIAYGSMYGNTENTAEVLASMLAGAGVKTVRLYDVSKTHTSYIMGEMFRYSHIVLSAPTYNAGIYLPMATLLHDMHELNLQNRKAAIISNGSWAPMAHKLMQAKLAECKNMELLAEPFVINSCLKPAQMPGLQQLADAIATSVNGLE